MPNIRHAIWINATIEVVYLAISTQTGLSSWWTPFTEAKAEIGTVARFTFGNGYFKAMEIKTLEPFQSVKWYCIAGADEWIDTSISFDLVFGQQDALLVIYPEMRGQFEQGTSDSGTLLFFQHDDWKVQSSMFAECNYTWGAFLRSLKLLCETGKGKPWPNQHRI